MKEKNIYIGLNKLKEIIADSADDLDLDLEQESSKKMLFSYTGDLFSFGSKIQVTLTPISKNKTRVSINAKSSFALQVFDWGTNSELENNLLEEIITRI